MGVQYILWFAIHIEASLGEVDENYGVHKSRTIDKKPLQKYS